MQEPTAGVSDDRRTTQGQAHRLLGPLARLPAPSRSGQDQGSVPEPHTALFRAIEVSVEALREEDPVAAQRYLVLAILLEDMAVAPVVQQTLWNVDEREALETAERFVSLSLAQRDDESGALRLHDLQLDYVRAQYPDREALALIHEAMRLSGAKLIEEEAIAPPSAKQTAIHLSRSHAWITA